MNLFENMEGSNRAEEIKPLINKWGKTGLLEGLSTQYKATVATMLEQQAKQIIKEGSSTTAGTGNSGFEQWTGVALPLVRRVFAQIASKEFVSVQPMNLPSGLVFYLDYKYGTSKSPFGFAPTSQSQVGTLQGVTNTVGAEATDGLYGGGHFGYSISSSQASATAASASVAASDVNYDGAFTASLAQYSKITAILPSDADIYAVRSFGLTSASVLITSAQIYPNFTTVSSGGSGYTASFIITGSAWTKTGATSNVNVIYSKQPTNDARGDFEAKPVSSTSRGMDTDLNIPEIELQMRSIALTAKTRKLKASWTPEFAQDLNAYHSIDAEAELTSMLSEYVSMEIDLEILDMLISAAATTDYWSAKVGSQWNGSNAFTTDTTYQGTGYIQGTWFQTLGTKLQKVSNQIHAKTLRGGANFLVCSPNVSTILESIPGYAADGDGSKMTYNMGVQKVGSMTGRYTVYKNPYMTENTILMGYRGNQFLETGAVYAPYVPLMLTPLVYDPVNFTPRRGVMTRYAKVVTRPEFYGKVYVADLNLI